VEQDGFRVGVGVDQVRQQQRVQALNAGLAGMDLDRQIVLGAQPALALRISGFSSVSV